MDNVAVVLLEKEKLDVIEVPMPRPGPGEVMIKVHSVGICGTDIHYWNDFGVGPLQLEKPQILGHECSGTVVGVGSAVKHLKVNDNVTLEPAMPCLKCEYCREGDNNLCPLADDRVIGGPGCNGALQRYFVHPENMCHKLPDNMTLEEGALVEPTACVVHAIQRVGVTVGHHVLVCGSGPMGLLSMQAAKAFGAGKVCVTDVNPLRLAQGKRAGADFTYLVLPGADFKSQTREIQQLMGSAPHVTLECTGVESSLRLALHATRPGGKVALIGLGEHFVSVPLCMSSLKQLDIVGVARYNNTFPAAIDLISSGRMDAKAIVTHKFPIEDAAKAFETVIRGEGNKVLIQC